MAAARRRILRAKAAMDKEGLTKEQKRELSDRLLSARIHLARAATSKK